MSQGFTKGTPIDTDGTLSLNSDIVVPSQKAVRTYVASQIGTPVSSVTASSPILSSGGLTPNISIPAATTSVNGYLTSTDWTTFNGKIGGSGTTNEIAYFTGGTTIGSLTTGTYPSLTELSYVKGVTSSIQTQFSGKQNTIGLTTVGTNLATLPNPSAISYLRINADNTVTALTLAQLKSDLGLSKTIITSNVVNSDATGAFNDVTGLSFSVVSGNTYRFKFFIIYSPNNVNTGARFSINGPTNTLLGYRATFTGTTAASVIINNANTYDSGTASGSTQLASGNTLVLEGIIKPSANGTVIARSACEIVAGATITAVAGSYVEYEQLI